ncbi:MAG: Plug domain-containing protein [Asticcacaulis sp.]
MKHHLGFTALGLVLSAPFFAASAQAQTAQAQTGQVTDTSDTPTEVIITAQRRVQAAKDVGLAVSVLSGKDLQRRGVNTVNDLQYQTPSLEITPAFGGGQPQFRLRGVGFEDYATNNTPTVGIYVDEVLTRCRRRLKESCSISTA